MKKTYINPSIVVVDMETEVMISTSPGDPTVFDSGSTIRENEEWSLGDTNDLWDEDWSE